MRPSLPSPLSHHPVGTFFRLYLAAATAILVLATWLPRLRVHNRWVRILDFPRPQFAILCLGHLVLAMRRAGFVGWYRLEAGLLAGSFLHQAWKLYPFTRFHRVESPRPSPDADPGETVGLLVANVLMGNRNAEGLLRQITREDPDLILLLETDAWWAERLEGLERKYTRQVKLPQPDTYGMILYSRLPLRGVRVEYRLHREIPSIHAEVELPGGRSFRLFCVHPRPPTEEDTDDRDGELYLVGREARESELPCIIAGDLNDVAWSRSTRLFQKVSGTLDPRVGRGFFNSFHAKYPFLRYSLDHVFHSPRFALVEMKRLDAFGSDHFPLYLRLRLDETRLGAAPPEPPDAEEAEHVSRTLNMARNDP